MSSMESAYSGTGTTLCPHCNTRFKIEAAQLESHQGMVRCGSCLQAFDARPGFIPDQPDPQLELPIQDELVSADKAQQPGASAPAEAAQSDSAVVDSVALNESESVESTDAPHHDALDFSQSDPAYVAPTADIGAATLPRGGLVIQPVTLAEEVAIVQDEEESAAQPKYRAWAMAALLLLVMLLAQATYFFRVDLAATRPGLKPALISYCKLLNCNVTLPQKTELMSIESSGLEADPAHDNQIILNAVLRNRATYAQAFPNLELTLNDAQDKPLARRLFLPADYLKAGEDTKQGLLANHDLDIKLHLDTVDIKPSGYRLFLFYPQ